MSKGACLCGDVSWKITAKPRSAYHCHCSMCRKAHGAAFATYYFIERDGFQWIREGENIIEFRSSPELGRSFCGQCGSVVPNFSDDGKTCYVPAGSHDDGPSVDTHIFVGSRAPWLEINDHLERFERYPEQEQLAEVENKPLPPQPEGLVRGSCLCGAIEFQISEPFKVVHNCHCTRCRRARAAAYTTNGFTSMSGVEFVKGAQHLKNYKLPEAQHFTHTFCGICGSGMPRIDHSRGIAVIPLGALDDDPVSRPVDHIYVSSKASWFEITDNLTVFNHGPE